MNTKEKNIAYNEDTSNKLKLLVLEYKKAVGSNISYRTILARLVHKAKLKDIKG